MMIQTSFSESDEIQLAWNLSRKNLISLSYEKLMNGNFRYVRAAAASSKIQ